MPDDVVPKRPRTEPRPDAREAVANLQSDLAYLRRQLHELRCRFHGELAVLALRIEENERRAMRRRSAGRWWCVAAVIGAWLWLGRGAAIQMLNGPIVAPGLFLVATTVVAAITVVVLTLHNQADRHEHRDRHLNWFRLTERD